MALVVKDPPSNAGDTGSIPDPGRSHEPKSDQALAPQLLSLRSKAWEPQLLTPRVQLGKPVCPKACTLQQETPPQ